MRNVPSAITLQNIAFLKLREMNDCVRFIVYRDHMIFDDVIVKLHGVSRYEEHSERLTSLIDDDDIYTCKFAKPVYLCKKGLNSYLVSAYVTMLSKSYVYRKNAMRVLKHFQTACDRPFDVGHLQMILVRLRTPRRQFLDYKWQVILR